MSRYPDPRTTARRVRQRGVGWGFTRVSEELRRPTYPLSDEAGWQVEKVRRLVRRTSPSQRTSPTGADVVAVYEYTAGNISFDFASFLVFAEAFARRHGKRTVFVVLAPRDEPRFPNPELQAAYTVDSQEWRLTNILIPLMQLHPATVGYAIVPDARGIEAFLDGALVYPPRLSSTFSPLGPDEDVLPTMRATDFTGLRAPAQAVRYIDEWRKHVGITDPMVVITLRQRTYDPLRNSDVPQWLAFADWVRTQGYAPVFVTDTDAAWGHIDGLDDYVVMHEAPWNLRLRMALYQAAYVNLFFSNGPGALAWLNRDVNYVFFTPVNEASLHASTKAIEQFGLKVGQERYTFAQPAQVMSWKTDTVENIRDEFLRIVTTINECRKRPAEHAPDADPAVVVGMTELSWVCPDHGVPLTFDGGWRCPHGCGFPVSNSVARFLGEDSYSLSFGVQWSKWPKTQLDSHTGTTVTRDRLRATLGPALFDGLAGMRVLEVGCGPGRFTEVLLAEGAFVCSVDMSVAIDANVANCPASEQHVAAQADATNLPLADGQFDLVLALGVIQHTPDPDVTMAHLSRHAAPGGWLVIDHYGTGIVHHLRAARAYRAVLRRMDADRAMEATDRLYRRWSPVHRRARSYTARKALVLLSPIVYYDEAWPQLDAEQKQEWGLLDTHDSLTDFYKHRRSAGQLRSLFERLGLLDVSVRLVGLVLVAKGRRRP